MENLKQRNFKKDRKKDIMRHNDPFQCNICAKY